ncbi:putative lysophospholipase L1 biosynthesis ABC-type transport system permease subunit [Thermosporothrix hazakensis]|jgi:predicted lysophospholipase L1 biosynthesis ABC-type transport system permease subunit|uniref:Putative lysophospholipase L1 biosynthesis ABC-type transport system permease subunit n=2 Tax=Thermosporothrix hazakensis TaxID=644383 RepID=A0A326UKE8_THEHA|nr:putative lysophospholipase L1 biosynthesis ABC-type transport system permease subunit [Thermosporothrix hazakensis]
MYFNYTTRSLARGGQRTLLAIFCVAVGVMAIVALQLVGFMIDNAFTSNVRDANGGDVRVVSRNQPFQKEDLDEVERLKKDGVIVSYTPVLNAQGSTGAASSSLRETFTVRVVDPAVYPLVTPPTFTEPQNGKIADLLKEKQIIVSTPFVEQYKKKIGDTFDLRIGSQRAGEARVIKVKVAGIVTDSGVLAQAGSVVLLSANDYKAALSNKEITYDTINIATASKEKANEAAKQLRSALPVATVQTVDDAVASQKETLDNIRKFLEISGLLALLIGGVGIVNTMQVLLSRRKMEIAMLKTTGYRRFDLYLLFGLETGLLGLIGGIIGAGASIAVSYVVRGLVEHTFQLNIPFVIDPVIVSGGVAIGLVTALIFGLLPIVQAANIRPLNVIRELPEGQGAGSRLLTVGLVLLLSVLFCVLAIIILQNDILLGVVSVYGTFVLLLILSLFFSLLALLISKLPVPERLTLPYTLLVVLGIACSAGIALLLPPFGLLLLFVSLLGLVVVFLPRTWKANIMMALRNLGRQRVRTTTTMLALFVGIFTIGLILVLGQNLRQQVNDVLAKALSFNVISITSGDDTKKLQDTLPSLPGLTLSQQHTLASTMPVAVNKKPIRELLPSGEKDRPSTSSLGRSGTLYYLSGIEGYDVGNNQIPVMGKETTITAGRNLGPQDAGTDNVLVSWQLASLDPLHLKVGDTITLGGNDRKSMKTVTVVGIYSQTGFGTNFYPIIGTRDTVKALSPGGVEQSIFFLKINPEKLNAAVDKVGKVVPNALVMNLANLGDFINQMLNNILLTLTTIASLSLIAGVIIIANAVALAMLERRRELGILKAVGYTSSSILGEVMLENGVIGGAGALVAMLLVTLSTSLLGSLVFQSSFGVSSVIALGLILGSALLAMLTAALVAWGAVRVRPLEVLRYE